MFVRQLFVHLYMVGQLIGMLSVMIWQEIFIAIIGCVRKCWQIVEKTLRKNYIYSVCGYSDSFDPKIAKMIYQVK